MPKWLFVPASGGFSPIDIPGLQLWSDATDATTINAGSPVNGDLVANWNDKSGNSRNWLQATGARKPTYTTSIINGLPGINFIAANANFMNLGSLYNIGALYTAYVVYRPKTTTNHWILSDSTMSTGVLIAFAAGVSLNDFDPGGGSFTNTSATTNNTDIAFLSTISIVPSTGIHYLNWVSQTMSSGGANFNMSLDTIGSRANGGFGSGQSCDGYMGEIALWNRVISGAERIQLQNYSVAKWGV